MTGEMKNENTISIVEERKDKIIDKHVVVRLLLEESLSNPIINAVVRHFSIKYGGSKHKPTGVILLEHYDEVLYSVVFNLLQSNSQVKKVLEDYLTNNIQPIVIEREK